MKKYFAIFITAIMLLALLTSCKTPQNTDSSSSNCLHEYSDDHDRACNLCGEERETISVPPSPPPTDEGEDETSNGESTECLTYHFNYDYGFHITNIATLLVDDGKFGRGFESVIIPEDIVAGDTISIDYEGEIITDTMYPSIINLYSGEIKSYSFSRAHVVHLSGDGEFSIERIKNNYDYTNDYVILDRSGKFVKLDEYTGNEIYLVTDQKRYIDNGFLEGVPDVKYPITCMLAYNPRDLADGLPQKTVSELRNEKVTINLDHPSIEIEESDPTWRYAGYIGYNENGNEYIKYAPNYYKYFLTVSCKDDVAEVLALLSGITLEGGTVEEPSDNTIKIEFSDYDAYSAVEEELLNSLSALESVEQIEVGYIEPYSISEKFEGYQFYTKFAPIDCGEKLIKTYEEFIALFDLTDEKNAAITAITEEMFEDNYALFVSRFSYCGGVKSIDDVIIKDAKLADGRLYLTEYECFSGIHDLEAIVCPILIVIPKAELEGVIEEFDVTFFDVYVHLEVEE